MTPFLPLFVDTENQYGLPSGFLSKVASIESGGNPNARNPNSTAGGLFQFLDSTAKQYGLSDKFDPVASTDAAGRLARDNASALKQGLGREPTAGELYLAHQQGAQGALKLLGNPNAPTSALVGDKAAAFNGGDNTTAGQFAQKWTSKFDGRTAQPRQAPMADDGIPQQAPGGLGGLGGYVQGQGFGNLLQAIGASLMGNDNRTPLASVGPMLAQLQAAQGKREDTQYERTRQAQQDAFQREEAKRAQGNTDRNFGLQKGQFDLAVQQAKDPQTTEDIKNYNFAVKSGFTGPFSEYLSNVKKPQTQVNIDQKAEGEFEKTLSKEAGERFGNYVKAGDAAQTRMADINGMREISDRAGSQGAGVNAKLMFGPYLEAAGVKVDGLSDAQTYDAMVKRLAPTLRAPGSGSTSDVELKGFTASIGTLANNPIARSTILDTFEAAARNDMTRAEIATKLQTKEISRSEAEKQLRSLPDPMAAFREFKKTNPELYASAVKEGFKPPAKAAQPMSLPQGVTPDAALQQARAAIAGGKDRNAIIDRLRGMGIDPSGL